MLSVFMLIQKFQINLLLRRGIIVPYLHCMNNCLWFIWAGRFGVVFRLDTIRPISVWTNKLKRDTSRIIIKVYHTEFWLLPKVSNRGPIIRLRALALALELKMPSSEHHLEFMITSLCSKYMPSSYQPGG